ncbi:FtsW/RodA/SpoVE family cell cycle protein [Planctomicrobium piriforme]|uniref:Probable peptidoglycan glycosyltransferase FtsW n=1 Tax=Planctomicrobium piriforme TaxID=1576369 RepID=A0A1I3AYU2_9PLAN|nr:putative peptidoglycan glycosyltransferase FtsW [Planctomicrobium piriforme]SFH55090.1 cell division protein FtsW [Planctomicrobium piriforme]
MSPVNNRDDSIAGLFVTCAGLLLAVGMLMVYSSSITAVPSQEEQLYLSRQLTFLLAAGLAGILASQLPAWVWRKGAPVFFLATVVLLVLVLVPGIGRSVNGAQRWFRLGFISLQPSETAKLTLPMLLCAIRYGRKRGQLQSLSQCAALAGVTMLLVAAEPDLGTAIFLGMSTVLVMWLSHCPTKYFVAVGALTAPVVMLAALLRPYQLARLQGFADTWLHPERAPYQVQQSLTTLGVGGISGTGLGKGWQKLSFLPEANTDFVFAVIGEELGLIGTLSVMGLWAGLYLTGLKLIRRVPHDSFEGTLALTLLGQLVIQAGVNMAVVTALLPPKGISHPFISYGGSNLIVSILALGVILSLTRQESKEDRSETVAFITAA